MAKSSGRKVVNSIPSSESGARVNCVSVSGKRYVISQNLAKAKFTLWSVVEGGYERIATGSSPIDLYSQVNWNK